MNEVCGASDGYDCSALATRYWDEITDFDHVCGATMEKSCLDWIDRRISDLGAKWNEFVPDPNIEVLFIRLPLTDIGGRSIWVQPECRTGSFHVETTTGLPIPGGSGWPFPVCESTALLILVISQWAEEPSDPPNGLPLQGRRSCPTRLPMFFCSREHAVAPARPRTYQNSYIDMLKYAGWWMNLLL